MIKKKQLSYQPTHAFPTSSRKKLTLLGASALVTLTFFFSGCSSTRELPSLPTPPPVENPVEETSQAQQALTYFITQELGLNVEAFREDWLATFAQKIEPYVTTTQPTLEDMMAWATQAYNDTGDLTALQMLTQLTNLHLAANISEEQVCGIECIRDGTSPAIYDVESNPGWIVLRYGDPQEGALTLGKGLEAYLATRVGVSFEPLKPEVVGAIQQSFGDYFLPLLEQVPMGGSSLLYKDQVYPAVQQALEPIRASQQ